MLLKKQQLPPLLLMLVLTVLRECMGADTVRLFSRPFWEAVRWTHNRRGFFFEQIENAFYLLGACVASSSTAHNGEFAPVQFAQFSTKCSLSCISCC
jgi:hypothetical protein